MNETIPIDVAEKQLTTSSTTQLIRWSCMVGACAFTLIGLVTLLTALTTTSTIFKLIEVFLSIGILAAGVLLWRTFWNKDYQSRGVGLLSGEIALACAFVYLGVAMPAFHQGLAPAKFAAIQFIAVLAMLFFGSAELALSGFSKESRPLGQVTFPSMVRDGVILLTGTVLLGIVIGIFPGATIKPPHWNWVSFLGITIPGMLLLVAREGVKERAETRSGSGALPYLVATEILLILGLTLMFYGSYANLTSGTNGYQVGWKGNIPGLALWLTAILLLFVRGFFKLSFSHKDDRLSRRIISKALYIVAVVLFIYGERAMISGQTPHLAAGAAAPGLALLLLGGLLVLVVGRAANQKVCSG